MAPRGVVKEVDLFITRRVAGREMRLRPSKKTNQLFGYVVAVIANKLGVSIHAICVMSDHYHVVLHDWFGNVVDFTRDVHHFVASALNHAHGDSGSLWESCQTNRVRPVLPTDTIDRIAYTMANPVKHGGVKFARSWPGLRRAWPNRAKTFKRPKYFFRKLGNEIDKGEWPETATLELARPLGFDHLSDNELALLIHERIEETEERFRAARIEAKKGFMTRRQALEVDRYARATNPENKRRRIPTIACADPELLAIAREEERAFRAAHREAFEVWRAGDRDVEFPHGTYKMRVVHQVNVAGPPH